MNRQFSLTHTARYDECNCHGVLTPAAFLRYVQEIAARDAEDARLAGEGYWVIKRTVMNFTLPISVHTRLELKPMGSASHALPPSVDTKHTWPPRLVTNHWRAPARSGSMLIPMDARGAFPNERPKSGCPTGYSSHSRSQL